MKTLKNFILVINLSIIFVLSFCDKTPAQNNESTGKTITFPNGWKLGYDFGLNGGQHKEESDEEFNKLFDAKPDDNEIDDSFDNFFKEEDKPFDSMDKQLDDNFKDKSIDSSGDDHNQKALDLMDKDFERNNNSSTKEDEMKDVFKEFDGESNDFINIDNDQDPNVPGILFENDPDFDTEKHSSGRVLKNDPFLDGLKVKWDFTPSVRKPGKNFDHDNYRHYDQALHKQEEEFRSVLKQLNQLDKVNKQLKDTDKKSKHEMSNGEMSKEKFFSNGFNIKLPNNTTFSLNFNPKDSNFSEDFELNDKSFDSFDKEFEEFDKEMPEMSFNDSSIDNFDQQFFNDDDEFPQGPFDKEFEFTIPLLGKKLVIEPMVKRINKVNIVNNQPIKKHQEQIRPVVKQQEHITKNKIQPKQSSDKNQLPSDVFTIDLPNNMKLNVNFNPKDSDFKEDFDFNDNSMDKEFNEFDKEMSEMSFNDNSMTKSDKEFFNDPDFTMPQLDKDFIKDSEFNMPEHSIDKDFTKKQLKPFDNKKSIDSFDKEFEDKFVDQFFNDNKESMEDMEKDFENMDRHNMKTIVIKKPGLDLNIEYTPSKGWTQIKPKTRTEIIQTHVNRKKNETKGKVPKTMSEDIEIYEYLNPGEGQPIPIVIQRKEKTYKWSDYFWVGLAVGVYLFGVFLLYIKCVHNNHCTGSCGGNCRECRDCGDCGECCDGDEENGLLSKKKGMSGNEGWFDSLAEMKMFKLKYNKNRKLTGYERLKQFLRE